MKLRFLALATALFVAGSLPAAARTPVPVIDPAPVIFSSSAPPDATAFKAILLRAASSHDWTLQREQDDTYTLQLVVRNKHTAAVDVRYTATGYQITYASSANLNYTDKGGTRLIHPHYNTWVEALNRAIQLELTKASAR